VTQPSTERLASWLARRPFLLFLGLYLGLALLAALLWPVLPAALHRAVEELTGGRGLGLAEGLRVSREASRLPPPEAPLWAIATVAMVCAGALALPLAWLYTITRHKRGYRQSVVHSLILLPVVVAGVAVLVKFSLALAFSLAGIVAAVRFRTTLEDSKDAVYIFVATGIGLASGVELSVAATLSVVFNLATLLLFHSEFGRTPARLEGEMAEARMRRALAMANRTSQFVARLDREILEDMAPEQLEALADRAWHRRQESGPAAVQHAGAKFDAALVVRTDGGTPAREAVERALHMHAKRWQFQRGGPDPASEGGQILEYAVKLRKSVQPTWFLDVLRREAAPGLRNAELK
jgi:uncharacterized membrane protein YhiD involved in acid resistance